MQHENELNAQKPIIWVGKKRGNNKLCAPRMRNRHKSFVKEIARALRDDSAGGVVVTRRYCATDTHPFAFLYNTYCCCIKVLATLVVVSNV